MLHVAELWRAGYRPLYCEVGEQPLVIIVTSGVANIYEKSKALEDIINFARARKWGRKPLIMVLSAAGGTYSPGLRALVQERMLQEGVPVYFSLERASNALSKFVGYHQYRAAGAST